MLVSQSHTRLGSSDRTSNDIGDFLVSMTAPMPQDIKQNLELHAGCIAGAALITELQSMLEDAGFTNILVKPIDASKALIDQWFEGMSIGDYVVSATIEAVKP